MTPKKNELTPRNTITWLTQIRKGIEKRGGSPDVKFQIRYMFKYIETLVKYQEPMLPEIDAEDGSQFIWRKR